MTHIVTIPRPRKSLDTCGACLATRHSMTISEDGNIPSTIQVECPNCGRVTSIPMKFSDGPTIDYQGMCTGSIRVKGQLSPTLCKTAILITYTIPEESDRGP